MKRKHLVALILLPVLFISFPTALVLANIAMPPLKENVTLWAFVFCHSIAYLAMSGYLFFYAGVELGRKEVESERKSHSN